MQKKFTQVERGNALEFIHNLETVFESVTFFTQRKLFDAHKL